MWVQLEASNSSHTQIRTNTHTHTKHGHYLEFSSRSISAYQKIQSCFCLLFVKHDFEEMCRNTNNNLIKGNKMRVKDFETKQSLFWLRVEVRGTDEGCGRTQGV